MNVHEEPVFGLTNHPAPQDVFEPQETCDGWIGWTSQNLFGRSRLSDLSRPDQHEAVREPQRLIASLRHEHQRATRRSRGLAYVGDEAFLGRVVHPVERFVEQQCLGLGDESAGQRHTSRLAA